MGRISGLRNRVIIITKFFNLVLHLNKHHGSDFTIKWLKCCYVALQKAQANDNLLTLRSLEPDLPLPRLINGLPSCIGSKDRSLIKKGHPSIIRFWSSLFSIYRVLKCSYKLKTETITSPFTGDAIVLERIMNSIKDGALFSSLSGYEEWRSTIKLAPSSFVISTSASPTAKIAWTGILTECYYLLSQDSSCRRNIESYISVLASNGFSRSKLFLTKIQQAADLADRFGQQGFNLTMKCSSVSFYGQFALKEEAAGKLRVFALVDCLTQSVLKPLHDSMFSLLRIIPNDGTFDQDASVKRSRDKALEFDCAFSFDLSAATDRLPSSLSALIIERLYGIPGLGEAWRKLMIDREFFLNDKDAEKYDVSQGPYVYSVGQPMGAYSSWSALALTHHFILQYAYSLVSLDNNLFKTGYWCTQYEILGDDLVIFNPVLAQKYLELCTILGVTINLTKSINSPNKPVFEFAKRTINGKFDVSPVPLKQLLSISLGDRIGQFLDYRNREMIPSISVLVRLISRFGGLKRSVKDLLNPILAILGVLHSKNVIPHRWLVESVIAPVETFDFNTKDLHLPLLSSLKLILDSTNQGIDLARYPWSHEEIRKEIYDDYEEEFANVAANRALTLAKKLEIKFDDLMLSNVLQFFAGDPKAIFQKWGSIDDLGLKGATIGWFEENLTDWDPDFDIEEFIESIEEDKNFYHRFNLERDKADSWERKAESLWFKFDLKPKSRTSVKDDTCKVLYGLSKISGNFSQSYWKIERASW